MFRALWHYGALSIPVQQEYSESLNCGIPRAGLSYLSRLPELCQPIQPGHYTGIKKSFTAFAPPFTPRLSTREEFTFL